MIVPRWLWSGCEGGFERICDEFAVNVVIDGLFRLVFTDNKGGFDNGINGCNTWSGSFIGEAMVASEVFVNEIIFFSVECWIR